MFFIYDLLVRLAAFFLSIAALFNNKLRLFTRGRKEVFNLLGSGIREGDKVIWIHTASLGEFEQGLPVIEQIKKDYPFHKVLVTFFSPSGYEVKKNTPVADIVCYLPLDTRVNAKKFVSLVNPVLAIFVKYEFWPNYLEVLHKRKIPALSISSIFNENQIFFKPWGGFMRRALQKIDHFFVQDEKSKSLLATLGIEKVTVSGDTRFDRVAEILERDNNLSFMKLFKGDNLCFVAGSTWPEDEEVLVDYINRSEVPEVKFVIAPHNINPTAIAGLQKNLKVKSIRYSELDKENPGNAQVLILDTIGLLTKVYSYADIAYVGGGLGKTGLHNTLEPAVFGIPVIIGKHYSGFKEAEELVKLGGLDVIAGKKDFVFLMSQVLGNRGVIAEKGSVNSEYIKKNRGSKIQIGYYIRKIVK